MFVFTLMKQLVFAALVVDVLASRKAVGVKEEIVLFVWQPGVDKLTKTTPCCEHPPLHSS